MTQTVPDAETQAPFLVVTADLGERPELGTVSSYISALDVLAAYSMALAVYSSEWAQLPPGERSPSWRARVRRSMEMPMDPTARASRLDLRHTPEIAVDRIRLASPLEMVLATVASDVKPIGYAVAGMALLKSGLGMIMDWQRHRAELIQMVRGRDVESETGERMPFPMAGTDAAQAEEIITKMQEGAGMPAQKTTSKDVANAVECVIRAPLVQVQGDTDLSDRGHR